MSLPRFQTAAPRPLRRSRRLIAAGALVAWVVGGTAVWTAQWQWDRGWRWYRVPPRFARADSFDGYFNFCRIMYESVRREAGGMGWWTDYPSADVNLSIRLAELTKVRISRQPSGDPNHLVVRLTDEALFQCPFAIIEDAGTAAFSPEEVERLRQWLLKGGFLWVDDFWGERAWEAWRRELGRVLPPAEYPIVPLTMDHPIFKTLFEVRRLPQIPSIQFWRASGGLTSERGAESAEPDVYGISDRRGRLMVLMTHDTDIADAWEREGEDPDFFYRFSVDGYAVAINALLYTMTH
jgi:hypothetical protein